MRNLSYFFIAIISAVIFSTSLLPAQTASNSPNFASVHEELIDIKPDFTQCAAVHNFTLKRDVANFVMNEGALYLCSPVAGRVCGAIFVGKGAFSFKPPTDVEREQLQRFYKKQELNEECSSFFFLFSDTTLQELKAKFKFSAMNEGSPKSVVNSTVNMLQDLYNEQFINDTERGLIEFGTSNYFFGAIGGGDLDNCFFAINPYNEEEICFFRDHHVANRHIHEVINQFQTQDEYAKGLNPDESKLDIDIESYHVNCSIDNSFNLVCETEVQFTTLTDNLRWIFLELYEKLQVDSVVWSDGSQAKFYKPKKGGTLRVDCPSPQKKDAVASITIYYHGEIGSREENLVFLASSTGWYPQNRETDRATFDMTFHTSDRMKFIGSGELAETKTEGEKITSHWIISTPEIHASFNLGPFEELKIKDERIPPTSIWFTSYATKQKNVAEDVQNSIIFYQFLLGKPPFKNLNATEIPYDHGQAFPNFLHLSLWTFISGEHTGYEEIFVAHEMAHEWWGMSMAWKTYHDQWLSEAFAEYSAMWYTQLILKDNKKFFSVLDDYRSKILSNRKSIFGNGKEAGPIWLGGRTNSFSSSGDYNLIIYKKGAWVLHMLRNYLLDLKTMNEDKFTGMMREFYTANQGKNPSTEDFLKVVEKYAGQKMDWFFKQWIYGTSVPTYSFKYSTTKTPEGKFKVTCNVKQANVPDDFQMYVPVKVDFGDNKYVRLRILVKGKQSAVDLPSLPLEPKNIVFNDLESVLCDMD